MPVQESSRVGRLQTSRERFLSQETSNASQSVLPSTYLQVQEAQYTETTKAQAQAQAQAHGGRESKANHRLCSVCRDRVPIPNRQVAGQAQRRMNQRTAAASDPRKESGCSGCG